MKNTYQYFFLFSSHSKTIIFHFFFFLKKGNRECHLVILKDDDIVEWGEFPPSNGEEYAESMSLFYFFI